MIKDEFSVKLQNSSSLTQAWSSLIRHPVANSRRNAVFLKDIVSELGSVPFSRKSNTVLSFQVGAVEIVLGL